MPTHRRALAAKGFQVSLPDSLRRVDAILHELKTLDVNKYPNASAVLFRTFIEVSVAHYMTSNQLTIHRDEKLSSKTERVIRHLQENRPDDAKQPIKAVRAGLSKPGSLFSISTLNEWVHNARWAPVPSELQTYWDNWSDFLGLLWA